ncbi:GGDEF domain-containing protein [Sporomusa termitida]|uniref:GGDEF: diguanylate cyclase (GGDEF) domain protein n=1 Tax=Sporomusa termitida TaxID=2377 RepID=A0A517DZ06_9FIRM|nr:GGDEF domain-containing protein [Sporomusa termitida]QDR82594.1 GGDEF: diguanylate cyclase (GGDEF) domain protein [Sporomusa termitida]
MFYNYAWLILSSSGALIGITGYYLDIVLPGNYGGLLWAAITGVIAGSGLIIGSLIRKLSLISHTDFLTGLWNRRYFYLTLQKQFCQAAAQRQHLCVAMIDVDGFKTINDTYGHTTGDQLLSGLAALLKKNAGGTVVTRWGGDEFAIIFAGTTLEKAREVMEKIRRLTETNFLPYQLTISAGVVPLKAGQTLNEFLSQADHALYKAKIKKNAIITIIDDEPLIL